MPDVVKHSLINPRCNSLLEETMSITMTKRKGLALFLIFISSLLAGMVVGGSETRAVQIYQFYRSGFSFWRFYTDHYDDAIDRAITEYNTRTVVSVSNPVYGPVEVQVTGANFGLSGWAGRVTLFNDMDEPCSLASGQITGNCNETNKKAHYGYVDFNTFYNYYVTETDFVVLHEFGHVLGLGHLLCDIPTVMKKAYSCSDKPSTLQRNEITGINTWY